jgi:hypothetical protein
VALIRGAVSNNSWDSNLMPLGPAMKRLCSRGTLALTISTIFLFLSPTFGQSTNSAKSSSAVPTAFYAASITPSASEDINMRWESARFIASMSVERLIGTAYGLRAQQLEGLPNWTKSKSYTIEAVMSPGMPQLTQQEIPQVRRRMLQLLLADRFGLESHKTTKQLSVYEIVVAKGGPKLTPYNPTEQVAVGSFWQTTCRCMRGKS